MNSNNAPNISDCLTSLPDSVLARICQIFASEYDYRSAHALYCASRALRDAISREITGQHISISDPLRPHEDAAERLGKFPARAKLQWLHVGGGRYRAEEGSPNLDSSQWFSTMVLSFAAAHFEHVHALHVKDIVPDPHLLVVVPSFFPSLHTLNVQRCNIRHNDFSTIANLQQLASMEVHSCWLDQVSTTMLSPLTSLAASLTRLTLVDLQIKQEDRSWREAQDAEMGLQAVLAKLTRLKELGKNCGPDTCVALEQPAAAALAPTLASLSLFTLLPDDEEVEAVFSHDSVAALTALTALTTLRMATRLDTCITLPGLEALARLPFLQHVQLPHVGKLSAERAAAGPIPVGPGFAWRKLASYGLDLDDPGWDFFTWAVLPLHSLQSIGHMDMFAPGPEWDCLCTTVNNGIPRDVCAAAGRNLASSPAAPRLKCVQLFFQPTVDDSEALVAATEALAPLGARINSHKLLVWGDDGELDGGLIQALVRAFPRCSFIAFHHWEVRDPSQLVLLAQMPLLRRIKIVSEFNIEDEDDEAAAADALFKLCVAAKTPLTIGLVEGILDDGALDELNERLQGVPGCMAVVQLYSDCEEEW